MTAADLVAGWCPDLFAPMAAADGLLVRVRPDLGRLTGAQAQDVADLAARFGNGRIVLTNRGNLQLRGFSSLSAMAALEVAIEAGLAGPTPHADRARGILVSPLADIDPGCAPDTLACARALQAALLAAHDELAELVGKFGFAVDGGGRAPIGALAADLVLRACGRETGQETGHETGGEAQGRWALVCGGIMGEAMSRTRAVAACIAVARICARRAARPGRQTISAFPGHPAGSMSPGHTAGPVIPGHPAGPVIPGHPAGRVLDDPSLTGEALLAAVGVQAVGPADRATIVAADWVGPLPGACSPADAAGHTGVAAPFGRLTAAGLAGLGRRGPIRITPWRVMIVQGGPVRAGPDLIVAPDDARLGVEVCAGLGECARARADVVADARHFADAYAAARPGFQNDGSDGGAGSGAILHVSGCAKGCAHPGVADTVLVARDGRYDLVRHGRADDPPVLRGLAGAAALRAIRERVVDGPLDNRPGKTMR